MSSHTTMKRPSVSAATAGSAVSLDEESMVNSPPILVPSGEKSWPTMLSMLPPTSPSSPHDDDVAVVELGERGVLGVVRHHAGRARAVSEVDLDLFLEPGGARGALPGVPFIGGDDGAVGQRDGLRGVKTVEGRIAWRVVRDEHADGVIEGVGDVFHLVVENFRIAVREPDKVVLTALVVVEVGDRRREQKQRMIRIVNLVGRDQVEIIGIAGEVGGQRGRALQVVGELDLGEDVIFAEAVVVDK